MDDIIRPPSDDDWSWLDQAEQHILGVLRHHYGDVNLTHSSNDLLVAQRLVNDKLLNADQLLELQCLGVILGNVFAAHTSMQWAVVTSEFGEMLALHSEEIGFTLYPLTMISKRMEQGRHIDIPGLYRSFVADLGLVET